MSSDDWYRNETWSPAIEKAFFDRLSRCRSQRDQCLVIQALILEDKRPEVTLRLVELYFETTKDHYEDVRALSAKASALLALSRLEDAVSTLKEILDIERQRPGTKSKAFVKYPYLVAVNRLSEEYPLALATLKERVADLALPVDTFLWHAARSLILFEQGKLDESKRSVIRALEAAQVTHSGFLHHRNLGLVGEEHRDTVARLREINA